MFKYSTKTTQLKLLLFNGFNEVTVKALAIDAIKIN